MILELDIQSVIIMFPTEEEEVRWVYVFMQSFENRVIIVLIHVWPVELSPIFQSGVQPFRRFHLFITDLPFVGNKIVIVASSEVVGGVEWEECGGIHHSIPAASH